MCLKIVANPLKGLTKIKKYGIGTFLSYCLLALIKIIS